MAALALPGLDKIYNSRLISRYISKEFFKSFIVSFLFFFIIFFVNSILLLVQRILLKNISLSVMLEMVVLYMPQFLVYTFPFATLTASSMVLGDMSSSNELLALRSLGISRAEIYRPLIIISLFLSLCTFLIADVLQPYTSVIYRDKLAVLMAEMPTMEIESNSTNSIGNIILSNGKADGDRIEDIVLITKDEKDYDKTVVSKEGTIKIIDNQNFVYALTLEDPDVLISDVSSASNFSFIESEKATFYLDFSSQIPSLTSTSPVNLTSSELISIIKERNQRQSEDRYNYWCEMEDKLISINSILKNSSSLNDYDISRIEDIFLNIEYSGSEPVNFYGQYYKSELTKKYALSLACFVLTLLTLPLSNIKVKYGKLTGFAIAILVAVLYWYMLFAAQLLIFDITFEPYVLILAPDIIIAFVAVVLMIFNRKGRS